MKTRPELGVQLRPHHPEGLSLQNPVMPASGTFGYGTEYADLVDINQLGAVVTKGITLIPWTGNPQPRVWETSSGMLNSIGLENIGVDVAVREKAPLWARWRVPVIVNIAGHTIDEYATVARKLSRVPGVAALELNISCPNVAEGGMEFGVDPVMAATVTRHVRGETALPLIVKLSPNVTDISPIAAAVVLAGADALCVANTLRGTAIDIHRRTFRLGRPAGGLSGQAIKPVALHLVHRVAHEVDVPVIGCGGIATAEDALEFIMAGATAVQVGTATFTDARSMFAIIQGIESFMSENGVRTLSELRGIVH
ncbi:MAG: dihydroorotate dehydrogenase [Dehalococcoidia bacterium]|nr:dihydroorotate dehydrogenase [Dehalococcoidia bacterium]